VRWDGYEPSMPSFLSPQQLHRMCEEAVQQSETVLDAAGTSWQVYYKRAASYAGQPAGESGSRESGEDAHAERLSNRK
jgi:hypothetical protein